jgi:MFS family permease
MTSSKPAPIDGARPGLVTAVVCLALAAVVSAIASLNVALPEIARDTHASQTELVWVIDAYSLVFAALLLPAGGIGDRYGRRVALISGLVIFGGGSALAIAADSARVRAPEQVRERLEEIRACGIDRVIVVPGSLDSDPHAVDSSCEQFAREIIPSQPMPRPSDA